MTSVEGLPRENLGSVYMYVPPYVKVYFPRKDASTTRF